MNIYIANNYINEPISIIMAENKQLAEVVFMAMGINHHSVEEINPNEKDIGQNGVVFLMTSTERVVYGDDCPLTIREWVRGL